ncbi:unnamed protein product [Moneuplotes crassus]|uniref:Uncharacterized protein n=1 Tax=Euplotes crassus TaxID=5936 RepID=A0AAD1UR08_EUPCR|nr:unnamed protein product [Moneuplotes crassus]
MLIDIKYVDFLIYYGKYLPKNYRHTKIRKKFESYSLWCSKIEEFKNSVVQKSKFFTLLPAIPCISTVKNLLDIYMSLIPEKTLTIINK